MLFISLMCVNLLLASADNSKHNGHCDKNARLCEKKDQQQTLDLHSERLLFYDVNPPEGFNLRRDVYMRFAIMLAESRKRKEKMNWNLVLPPWYGLYHWKSESHQDSPKPWSLFFDIISLNSYATVFELHQIMHNSGKYGLKIDSLYILQNFDDAFEDGDFGDKWNILGPCKYDGRFWGYRNITAQRVICVQFQGTITQLWEIIQKRPDDKKVMFLHGEIPLHSSYGTKTYWDCRKSMQFNVDLVEAADLYIIKELNCLKIKCLNYLAVHWRRQDFLRANRSPSVKGTAEQINKTITNKSLDVKDVFIASDGTEEELKLLEMELESLSLKAHFYIPDVSKFVDGQIAIIEQIICSRSAFFIGSHESTFTYRIQEEREILGFGSDTTFNRLCPDEGNCEKPSKWTIVN